MIIVSEKEKNFKRFRAMGREIVIKIQNPPQEANVVNWLEEAIFELYNLIVRDIDPDDFVGFTMCSHFFKEGAIWLSFRPLRDFDCVDVINMIQGVIQSNQNFEIDNTLTLTLACIKVPRGSGRRISTHEDVKKKSILQINNHDNYCLPRAIITGLAYVLKGQDVAGECFDYWQKVRKSNGRMQTSEALLLTQNAEVEITNSGCGLPEIEKFQNYLSQFNIALVIYPFATFALGGKFMFDGREYVRRSGQNAERIIHIMYFEESKHFRPILNLLGASGFANFCPECNKGYRFSHNNCQKHCSRCFCTPPCREVDKSITCDNCLRSFSSDVCFANHKKIIRHISNKFSVCDAIKICPTCLKMIRISDKHAYVHKCGYTFCQICYCKKPTNHLCYMRPVKNDTVSSDNTLIIFFDLETRLCNDRPTGYSIHEPNLCVAQQVCPACTDLDPISLDCASCGKREYVFKNSPVSEFVDYLLSKSAYRHVVVLSHYGSGFDLQFIFKYIVEMKKYRTKPKVVMRGTKIIIMNFVNLKFVDSFNYFHMPLSALPKAYGFANLQKGYFPHLFNTLENQNYIGPMPPVETFSPESMKMLECSSFLNWYEDQVKNNYVFDFQKEIVHYCRQDVEILRRACIPFRKAFLELCNVDPFFEASTIASTCLLVFRKKYLKKDTVGIVPRNGYRLADRQSWKALKWLSWMELVLNKKIHFSARGREIRLPEGILVDGFISSIRGKSESIVLQYHGCFYHACPRCFKQRNQLFMGGPDTFEDKFEQTVRTSERIKNAGYILIEVWECESDREIAENSEKRRFMESPELLKSAPLDPRDSFFGGRVENLVKLIQKDCKYYDVRSLYPWVCKNGEYPIGHPQIYVGKDCCVITGPENRDVSRIKGIVKCEVLPPRNLYFPILPVRMHGKLLFPLCRSCCEQSFQRDCPHVHANERSFVGTWIASEVQVAVNHGYQILEMFEIWQYEITKFDPVTKEGGLFAGYINEFFRLKAMASGFPPEYVTEEQKDAYVEKMAKEEGIIMSKEEIENNPGKRLLTKLLNNTLWGKFAQAENMQKMKVVTDPQVLFDMLQDPSIDVNSWLPVNEDICYVGSTLRKEVARPSGLTNVIIASFTTAQARLKLFSYLHPLGERCVYLDTDSIIFYSSGKPGEYEPPLGPLLGDLTDDLSNFGCGSKIVEFLSGGPKFYSFKVQKPDGNVHYVCKIKGIRLNHETATLINFDSIKKMILAEEDEPITINPADIRRTQFHHVISSNQTKVCRPVFSKRRFVGLDDSYPFGYEEKHLTNTKS